ncbi:ATP-dependent helicase [Bdellovibrionota bacterium]
MSIDLLAPLNPPQKEAVTHVEGPLLVLAGAGSGKTRVLTHRISYLIKELKIDPFSILAVTFTNKAAKEMQERVAKLLGLVGHKLWVSTFHSTCVRILREEIELLGYGSDFVIYDEKDQIVLVKQVLKALNINDKTLNPKVFVNRINRAKSLVQMPEEYEGQDRKTLEEKVIQVYTLYQEELKKNNALDFGDLLMHTVKIFEKNPRVLKRYQQKFKHILVDEYQDTNQVQYRFLHALSKKHQNVVVVGDEDQSIYAWRGADISNILSFEEDFPGARVIKLEQNYRSTKNIIEAASSLIGINQQRKAKKLWTENRDGDLIVTSSHPSEHDEAAFVVGEIEKLRQDGKSLNDFSVFYRTHAQSRVIEDELRRREIPYRIFGGMRFYDRAEIKNMLAYLRVLASPADAVSLRRVINFPARGIGKSTIEKLVNYSQINDISLWLSLERCNELGSGPAKKVRAFFNFMSRLRVEAEHLRLDELYLKILDEIEYVPNLRLDGTPEAEARIENLEELHEVIKEFLHLHPAPTLQAFLEQVSLVTDIDSFDASTPCLNLMTLHMAKGLEFPVVFMVGMEEDLFPHQRSLIDEDELEEERRLCYVGMTRAKQKLYLSSAQLRHSFGVTQYHRPSRFLAEIPLKFIDHQDLTLSVKPSIQLFRSAKGKTVSSTFGSKGKQSSFCEEDFDFDFDQRPAEERSNSNYQVGMKVKHPAFGIGIIRQIEGSKESEKVTIQFPSLGQKKFLTKFAQLQPV